MSDSVEKCPPPAERCANHPSEPARLRCTKYSKPLCDACAACQDPALYCKFRTGCVVQEIRREGKKHEGREDEGQGTRG